MMRGCVFCPCWQSCEPPCETFSFCTATAYCGTHLVASFSPPTSKSAYLKGWRFECSAAAPAFVADAIVSSPPLTCPGGPAASAPGGVSHSALHRRQGPELLPAPWPTWGHTASSQKSTGAPKARQWPGSIFGPDISCAHVEFLCAPLNGVVKVWLPSFPKSCRSTICDMLTAILSPCHSCYSCVWRQPQMTFR